MKCMKRLFLLYVAVFAVLLSFQSCKFEPATVNDWKPWVLSRADVEDYTAMDVVSRFIDQRSEIVVYNKHDEKYIKWWREEIQQGDWQDGYDDQELMDRFVELQEYYSMLAKLTLMNALITSEEDEDPVLEELAKAFFKLMGDEYLLLAFYESVEEDLDLNNLKTLSRSKLKNSMVEVIGDSKDFSLFESTLKVMYNEWHDGWWDPDVVVSMSQSFKDDFFENVMLLLGDFSELKQMIDDIVSVYSCEYNSGLSSDKADVFDVIYSIKDKMYVKCSILESHDRAEIKINNKSTHLLSL